jgi:hypothetical protein
MNLILSIFLNNKIENTMSYFKEDLYEITHIDRLFDLSEAFINNDFIIDLFQQYDNKHVCKFINILFSQLFGQLIHFDLINGDRKKGYMMYERLTLESLETIITTELKNILYNRYNENQNTIFSQLNIANNRHVKQQHVNIFIKCLLNIIIFNLAYLLSSYLMYYKKFAFNQYDYTCIIHLNIKYRSLPSNMYNKEFTICEYLFYCGLLVCN